VKTINPYWAQVLLIREGCHTASGPGAEIRLSTGCWRGLLTSTRFESTTYLRLLDADAQRADWREVARIVPHLDPEHDSDRARRAFDSHLSRAKWMTEHGYRQLLRGGASA
jgi:hypothetical protein